MKFFELCYPNNNVVKRTQAVYLPIGSRTVICVYQITSTDMSKYKQNHYHKHIFKKSWFLKTQTFFFRNPELHNIDNFTDCPICEKVHESHK